MTSIRTTSFARRLVVKGMMAGALLAAAISLPAQAAVDVNGYKFEDTAKVAGKDLKLNGAGMRTKLVFKVYAAGLYLTEKKTATADIMGEITAASVEQSAGIAQVSQTIVEMDQTTQQNAALVEQAAAAAAAMQDQAARLARAVSVFKLDQDTAQAPFVLSSEPRLALG